MLFLRILLSILRTTEKKTIVRNDSFRNICFFAPFERISFSHSSYLSLFLSLSFSSSPLFNRINRRTQETTIGGEGSTSGNRVDVNARAVQRLQRTYVMHVGVVNLLAVRLVSNSRFGASRPCSMFLVYVRAFYDNKVRACVCVCLFIYMFKTLCWVQ